MVKKEEGKYRRPSQKIDFEPQRERETLLWMERERVDWWVGGCVPKAIRKWGRSDIIWECDGHTEPRHTRPSVVSLLCEKSTTAKGTSIYDVRGEGGRGVVEKRTK